MKGGIRMAAAQPVPQNAKKKKRKFFSVANGFDMPFLIILMLILVIGLVCMYSASYVYAIYWYDGDSYYFIKRQLAFAVLGVVAMLMISTVDYHVLHKFAWIFCSVASSKNTRVKSSTVFSRPFQSDADN